MLEPEEVERLLEPDETEPEDLVLEPDERDTEPVDLVLEPEERTDPDERVDPAEPEPETEPAERAEPPLAASTALREPEVVAVLDPALVELAELETPVERELTDLDEALASERVNPVEASCEPTDLAEPLLIPVVWATSLEDALLTAAETPSILREPVVAKEPVVREVAEVAPAPARVVPPLRP